MSQNQQNPNRKSPVLRLRPPPDLPDHVIEAVDWFMTKLADFRQEIGNFALPLPTREEHLEQARFTVPKRFRGHQELAEFIEDVSCIRYKSWGQIHFYNLLHLGLPITDDGLRNPHIREELISFYEITKEVRLELDKHVEELANDFIQLRNDPQLAEINWQLIVEKLELIRHQRNQVNNARRKIYTALINFNLLPIWVVGDNIRRRYDEFLEGLRGMNRLAKDVIEAFEAVDRVKKNG